MLFAPDHGSPARFLENLFIAPQKEATVYPIKIDYLGFEIPNLFVVGYGLDYDGLGRNLSQIMQLES